MVDTGSFMDDLSEFVRTQAQGNKTKAAGMLDISRPEIHAYLKGRTPRTDKLSRLKAAIAAKASPAAQQATEAGEVPAELAFQLVRYLYDLVEDARARSRR